MYLVSCNSTHDLKYQKHIGMYTFEASILKSFISFPGMQKIVLVEGGLGGKVGGGLGGEEQSN